MIVRLAQLENENAELRAENKESKVQEDEYESGERESAVEEGGEKENSESENSESESDESESDESKSDESKSSGSEAHLQENVGWESEDGRFRTFKITPWEYFDGIDIDDIPSTVSSAEQDVVRTLMSRPADFKYATVIVDELPPEYLLMRSWKSVDVLTKCYNGGGGILWHGEPKPPALRTFQ